MPRSNEDYTLADVVRDALQGYRRRFKITNPDSHFKDEDDRGFLIELGDYEVDRKSEHEMLTVAGLLLFGCRRAIREWPGRPSTYAFAKT